MTDATAASTLAVRPNLNVLMEKAMTAGPEGVQMLKELVALSREVQADLARAEFFDAMAAFQRECPPIKKSSRAEFVTKSGGRASYTFAELDEIARTVNPLLARLGLSYSWDSSVTENGVLVCVCTLRHKDGHSTTASFGSKIEGSSLMSGHQATAATLTYARRQSLVQVLGLTMTDDDLDGRDVGREDGPTATTAPDRITDADALALEARITDVGANLDAFLRYFKIASVGDLPTARLPEARKMLDAKGRQAR